MPIFEFVCRACGHKWELLEKKPPKSYCPICRDKVGIRIICAPVQCRNPGGTQGFVDFGDHDFAKVTSDKDLRREAAKRGLVVNEC